MPLRMNKRWPFTRKRASTATALPVSQETKATPSYSLCPSIHKLPLSAFVDGVVDGDLSGLVVKGEPPAEAVRERWETLLEQHSEAMGRGAEGKVMHNLWMEVVRLESRLSVLPGYLDVIEGVYCPWLNGQINTLLNTAYRFDVTDFDAYEADIQGARTQLSSLAFKLERKRQEYEAMNKTEGGLLPTREYYAIILSNLSDWKGRHIDDNIMTFQFCHLVTEFGRHIDRENNKKK